MFGLFLIFLTLTTLIILYHHYQELSTSLRAGGLNLANNLCFIQKMYVLHNFLCQAARYSGHCYSGTAEGVEHGGSYWG